MSSTRQLAAIMFTDIVGYTSLMGKDEPKAMELVRKNREIQKPLIEKYHGTLLKEMGDGNLASFPTASDAIYCAREIQQALYDNKELNLRIGIHLGEIRMEGGDIYGDGVNVASRLETIADPGGIYISDTVQKSIRSQPDIQTAYLGELELKNVDYAVKTYAIRGEGLPRPKQTEKKHLSGRFWAEITRRNVHRAGLAYLAFGFIIYSSLRFFELGEFMNTLIISFLILGFPLSVLVAWFFERSPEGFVRISSRKAWENPYSDTQKKPFTGNLIIIILLVIIVGLNVFPGIMGSNDSSSGLKKDLEKSIAVLHFENMSQDEDNQYFADGVMESILNHLSKIKDLNVTSRTTVEQYRDRKKTAPEIATELRVSYILEGSVQKYGEQVRITAQLIDAANDVHMWSHEYDEDLKDIFPMMSRIALDVAKQLEATISQTESDMLSIVPTSDLDAYDLYLRGREYYVQYITQGRMDENLLMNSEIFFKNSLKLDSAFSLAYLSLGEVNYLRTGQGNRRSQFENEYRDSMLYNINKSLFYNPSLAEAYSLRGVYHTSKGQFEMAIEDQEVALSLNPDFVEPYIRLSINLRFKSDYINAYKYLSMAKRMEGNGPLLPEILLNFASIYASIDDYYTAIEFYKKVIELQPQNKNLYKHIHWAYCIQGKFDNALAIVDTICQTMSDYDCYDLKAPTYSFIGQFDSAMFYWDKVNKMEKSLGIVKLNNDINEAKILMTLGKRNKAEQILQRISNPEDFWMMAQIHAVRGNSKLAISFLSKFENQFPYLSGLIPFCPNYYVFDNIWNDKDFIAIIKRNEDRKKHIRQEIRLIETGLIFN